MYPSGINDKKSLNLLILEILKDNTDEEHRLRQDDIVKLLKVNYGAICERRSVKSNIASLINLGYDIPLKGGYCLMGRTFDKDELRLIIECLLSSGFISKAKANRLIEKVVNLESKYFQPKVNYITGLLDSQAEPSLELRNRLDILDEGIGQRRQVSFVYCSYGADFELHPLEDAPCIVNPYQIATVLGRYYLIANRSNNEELSCFRIDCMTDIRILDEKARPKMELGKTAREFILPDHLARIIPLDMEPETTILLRTKEEMIGTLLDWFGKRISIEKNDGKEILVSLKSSESAMLRIALQLGTSIEVLVPESLRKKIKKTIHEMAGIY